ncbi:MAG TPA: hypothetical protein VNO70_11365, partial [Blastocatellia bacterium]|nr:hypothetical protein [Blastocatellia bacterium]
MKTKGKLTVPEIRNPQSPIPNPQPDLQAIFAEALRVIVKREPRPEVEARFYPYAGMSSTIRLRQGRVLARISDLLTQSPPEVLYALACILVAKL